MRTRWAVCWDTLAGHSQRVSDMSTVTATLDTLQSSRSSRRKDFLGPSEQQAQVLFSALFGNKMFPQATES